jgi:hypothetical protein
MAKAYEAPVGVDIAALKTKQQNSGLDLMRPGPGTPWEDRGALGTPKAFFQTCMHSITKPGVLLDYIRRPDTTGEARQFAFGCCAFWALSVAIHMILYDLFRRPAWASSDVMEIDYGTYFYIKVAMMSVLIGAAAFFLFVIFANHLYYAMVSTELKNAAPRVLLYNIFCYCMGPSLLAIIPVVGPPLAIALIFFGWCTGGAKRLYISWRGAVVASALTMIISLVIGCVGFFVLSIILNNMLSLQEPVIDESMMPANSK